MRFLNFLEVTGFGTEFFGVLDARGGDVAAEEPGEFIDAFAGSRRTMRANVRDWATRLDTWKCAEAQEAIAADG